MSCLALNYAAFGLELLKLAGNRDLTMPLANKRRYNSNNSLLLPGLAGAKVHSFLSFTNSRMGEV